MSLDNKNNYNIYNFLDEHSVEKGKKYTHTSMGKPTGSFYIKEEELDTFYNLYQEAIFNGKKLHITEKHEDIGPIVIDLDFKYEHEIFERKHSKETIKRIIDIYNEIIINILDIEKNDPRLNAYVFERENVYRVKAITKDGIHILYPNIVTPPEVQYYIRECVLKKIVSILEELPLTNKPYDVVDRAVIRDCNWLLYGSSKPNIDPYQLTGIYNGNLEELNTAEYKFTKNIAHYFSIRNKKDNEIVHVRDDKQNLLENINSKKKNIRIKRKNVVVDDYDEIKKLVNILNDERAESYSEWISLGWLLHNIDENSQELLDIWIDFSKRSSKFKDGICEKEWNRSRNEGLGIPTLHYWAKIDNFEKYKEIQESSLNKLVEKSIKTPTHCDIANVLYKKYEYDFKYSNEEWYKFENHVWVKEKDGISLRAKISNELVEIYSKIISSFNKIITSMDPNVTEEDKEECKNKNKEVLEIIKKLKTTGFKDNILKECKEKFYDKNFVNKLDTNNYLLGFKNGIYDLQTGELRDGRPDDYLEMTTEIDKIDFEESNENFKDLEHFIDTIFIDPEIKEYFLLFLASCLQGHNAEEKFRIWTGNGSNGKSKLIELFVSCMGSYSIKFPITLLTGRRAASNSCNPELVKAKGKRFGYFEEPSENERINAGLMKEFTGGDKVYARGLHKDPIEFKPQWKLALLCNDIPEVPPHDSGTWRRMEIVEFKSRFCDNPKEPNEFAIDKKLSEKLKNWKELFMALLIDKYYVEYKRIGIKVPTEVIKFTLEFQKQCDIYTDFIVEKLEETKEMDDILEMGETYDEFKIWYEDTFSNHKYPSKVEFRKYLTKRYGKKLITTRGMKGFRFKDSVNEKLKNSMINMNEIGY